MNRIQLVVPTIPQFRRAGSRKRFIEKFPRSVASLYLFELAGQEILDLFRDGAQLPASHLKKLGKAFKLSLSDSFPKESSQEAAWLERNTYGTLNAKMERTKHAFFELPDGMPYFYRSINYAFVAHGVSSQSLFATLLAEAAGRAYQYFDWMEQLRIIERINGIGDAFGIPGSPDEFGVCNDWLKEQGLEYLVFPELVANGFQAGLLSD